MRVCVISSGNGGAFKAFFRLVGLPASNTLILTDRACGIEIFADDNAIEHIRLHGSDNQGFSSAAAAQIERFGGVDFVLLFFTRLITPPLLDSYVVVNFHPSLLPAFPGFQPIRRALQKGVKFIGTTMHVADQTADTGRILAQAVCPLTGVEDADLLERAAFRHKVHCMLLLAENFEATGSTKLDFTGWPSGDRFNPSLRTEKYRALFADMSRVDTSADTPAP